MIKVKKEDVKPVGTNVIVEIDESDKRAKGIHIQQEEISKLKVTTYAGDVIKTADKCNSVKVGEKAIIDKFAGSHINTGTESLIKVYSEDEISVTYDDLLTRDNLHVHGERVIVEVITKSDVNDGIYTADIDERDPRQVDMETGKVLVVGKKALEEGFKVGNIVAFDSYCGMPFEEEDGTQLKVIHLLDIKYLI